MPCPFIFIIICKEYSDLEKVPRPKKTEYLPTVLSTDEVSSVLDHMDGIYKLMAEIAYGGGLRRNELVGLRVHDIDFGQHCIMIRSGKGGKDRTTLLPATVCERLHEQVAKVKAISQTAMVRYSCLQLLRESTQVHLANWVGNGCFLLTPYQEIRKRGFRVVGIFLEILYRVTCG